MARRKRSALKWTQSNGGPLLVLDEAGLSQWSGVTLDDNVDVLDPETDYGRACVGGDIAPIRVGQVVGLTLNDEVTMPAAWWSLGPASGYLLRTFQGDDPRIPDALDRFLEPPPTAKTIHLDAPSGVLRVFDAALAGADVDEPPDPTEERLPSLRVNLRRGRYGVTTTDLDDLPGVSLIVSHFRAVELW